MGPDVSYGTSEIACTVWSTFEKSSHLVYEFISMTAKRDSDTNVRRALFIS